MSRELIELSNALAEVTEQAAQSVVAVHTETRGSSTGVVWRPGVIVTSEHALRRDEEIQVTLPDGRVLAAELAGRRIDGFGGAEMRRSQSSGDRTGRGVGAKTRKPDVGGRAHAGQRRGGGSGRGESGDRG